MSDIADIAAPKESAGKPMQDYLLAVYAVDLRFLDRKSGEIPEEMSPAIREKPRGLKHFIARLFFADPC